jgi:hypothetical protein
MDRKLGELAASPQPERGVHAASTSEFKQRSNYSTVFLHSCGEAA